MSKHILNSIAEIKQYFAANDVPYYFMSASNFNLMGMHDWVKNWRNINLIDCYDNQHPQVLMVENDHTQIFAGIEDINHYLINSPQAKALFDAEKNTARAIFLFFDERLEAICESLNIEIILPKNKLVKEIDSKIVTTEIGNQANVASVPNALAKIDGYETLLNVANEAELGERWVIQTPYGDSGKTTFFITNEDDYKKVAKKIEREEKVKIMRWINCRGTAIEACTTRWGTFVAPLLTEIIGDSHLTPYAGGWCGNELYEAAFSPDIRSQVLEKSEAIGEILYQRGYRGYFELDYLIDRDTEEVYLGELNARITGISAMTNLSEFSMKNLPLFLFHLLEYDTNVELNFDVHAFNQAMLKNGAEGTAAQMIMKYTEEPLKIITEAPVSGVYKLTAEGDLQLKQASTNRREALGENEAYILRISDKGEYAYKGNDLAILFLNQKIANTEGKLNENGQQWSDALKACFKFRHLNQEERSLVEQTYNPINIKGEKDE
ncbi:MAG: biotin carboxylase [Methylococcaceae bacterium]|nr:biotin carboxylase [Methylococcaceae bacterium]